MYEVRCGTCGPVAAPQSVPVEVGLSDGTYTQITSGLNEGDQVVVQMSNASNNNNFRGFGGGGGMPRAIWRRGAAHSRMVDDRSSQDETFFGIVILILIIAALVFGGYRFYQTDSRGLRWRTLRHGTFTQFVAAQRGNLSSASQWWVSWRRRKVRTSRSNKTGGTAPLLTLGVAAGNTVKPARCWRRSIRLRINRRWTRPRATCRRPRRSSPISRRLPPTRDSAGRTGHCEGRETRSAGKECAG